MSLPDTVFIFVLALIIFGPKKLPEIGRQLGKLVGEFRRASNEFKFQIEEELRQVELTDRQTIAAPSKELESSNSTPSSPASSDEVDVSGSPDLPYPEETLPVGQYPNIDNLDPYELNALNRKSAEPEAAEDRKQDEVVAEVVPASLSITPATGTEPRTTVPNASSDLGAITPMEVTSSSPGVSPEPESHPAATAASSTANPAAPPAHEPADPYAAPAVVDITHG
ncbi:MAG: twin-arginine translocase TatA/TatE family subunit [Acidobacteriaceae bacterium]